jgi:hypothetical protein
MWRCLQRAGQRVVGNRWQFLARRNALGPAPTLPAAGGTSAGRHANADLCQCANLCPHVPMFARAAANLCPQPLAGLSSPTFANIHATDLPPMLPTMLPTLCQLSANSLTTLRQPVATLPTARQPVASLHSCAGPAFLCHHMSIANHAPTSNLCQGQALEPT